MSKWYASTTAPPGQPPPTLVIECDRQFDAAQYAARVLGTEGLIVQETGEDSVADIALRFVGDDYAHGGTPNARRLEVRERNGKMWGKWRRANE